MLKNHRSFRFIAILSVFFVIAISSSSASAQRFSASLDGAQEVPPSGSAGVGYGNVTLSADQTTITVNMGFTGLGTTASAAHIHTGAVGVAGPVTFGLAGVPGATSGVIPQQTFAISAGQLADLLAGNMYFNIHTGGFPGGEIRGQILAPSCTTAMPIEVHATAGTMGPTGYLTLALAATAINGGTHQGSIDVEVCADTTELPVAAAASVSVNASGAGAALYTGISVFPAGGAARTISGAATSGFPLIDLNGADNVLIDGLNTGSNSLTISNTTVSGAASTSTIRFINDASSNTIQNTAISGSGIGTAGGTVIFGTTTGTTGNDNNTITACNVGPAGANLPINAILGSGTAANPNNGIIISNNNIFDFFSASTDGPRGILAAAGSDGWVITGNHLYQTGTRTFTTTVVMRAISIENTSGGGFNISNNFIGGSAPSAGGTAWTQAGAVSHNFIGIRISAGTAVATSIQNNTIRNISITNSATTSVPAGISLPSCSCNVGTVTGNTIGSQSVTGSITQTNASAGFFTGILSQPGTLGTLNISNNTIGGITLAGAGAQTLRGIRIEGGAGSATAINITNNTIGSTTTANSMDSNGGAGLLGISTTNSAALSTITGNTIQNLRNTSTATGAFITGIEATGSINGHNISNNTIRDATTTSTSTSTTTTAALAGIRMNGTSSGRVTSGNTIFNLSSTAAAAAVNVVGIVTGTSGMSGTINANNIYNLTTASTSATSTIKGMYLFNVAGTAPWNVTNNMIRLGTGVGNNPTIRGIHEDTATGHTNNIWFNSIYIGGTQGANVINTACVARTIAGPMDIRDNILWNSRSSTGAPGAGTGRHYAIQSTVATGTLTTNFNDLFVNGASGATIGFITSDRVTFADWQAAVAGFDTSSINADPLFVDPTNATTPDLHIQAGSPAINVGVSIVGVTTDFDGASRPGGNALFDIGADERDGILPPVNDIQATAFIDPTNGGTKLQGATFSPVASFTNNGTATQTSVTVRYRICADVGCTTVIYNQTATIASIASLATVNVTFPSTSIATIGTYTIKARSELATDTVPANDEITGTLIIAAPLSGTYTVGTGGNYPSLTNNGGIFEAINALGASNDVDIELVSDLTGELGTHALNEVAGSFAVRIFTCSAPRTITGSSTTALIRLNGADNVTIDGNPNTCGGANVGGNPVLRGLTIENTSGGASSAVVGFMSGPNGAQNNTIQNVNVDGLSPTTTLVGIHNGGATPGTAGIDNDGNDIINCRVRRAFFGIYSAGAAPPNQNMGTIIRENEISSATPADRIRRGGILVFNEDGILIDQNSVTAIDNTGEGADAFGIGVGTQFADESTLASGGVVNAMVTRNRISGVSQDATFSAMGIGVAGGNTGPVTLANNMVSGVISDGNAGDLVAGIFVVGTPGSVHRLYHNSVSMTGDRSLLLTPGTAMLPSYGVAVTGADPVVEFKNNIFYTTQTAALGANPLAQSFGIGLDYAAFTMLDSNYNDFFSTGLNDGGFRTTSLGNTGGVNLADLTAWNGATGDDPLATSQEVDPVFINPANDLHLNGLTPTPLLGDGLTGFAMVDHDSDPRPAAMPEIGADELVQSEAGSFPAGIFYNAISAPDDQMAGSATITNALTLNGILNTGNFNTITLECNAIVNNAGGGNYVVGTFSRQYCGIGSFTYPVGTNNDSVGIGPPEYTPVTANVTAGTFPSYLSARVFDGTLTGFDPANSLSRNWELEELGDITADLSFTYLDGAITDINGTEANYIVYRRNANGTTDPMCLVACVDTINNILGPVTGVMQFSRWSGAALAPTAAGVNVSGRVLTPSGAGLRNARVMMTDTRGVTRTVLSSSFGYYMFDDVRAGETYVISVGSKRFTFTPRTIQVLDELTDVDFTAEGER